MIDPLSSRVLLEMNQDERFKLVNLENIARSQHCGIVNKAVTCDVDSLPGQWSKTQLAPFLIQLSANALGEMALVL